MSIIDMNEWMMCISSNLPNINKNDINLEVKCSLAFIIQNKTKKHYLDDFLIFNFNFNF